MISDIISSKGIKDILHFTTNSGLVGILDTGYLRSHQRVGKDQRLEFILKNNSQIRKDTAWLDYVNLSITEINKEFFQSSERLHTGSCWRILSFDPEILTHEGVYFSTTNNIYPVAKRGTGPEGLESLFSSPIPWGYFGSKKWRSHNLSSAHTTDIQAEVLYPQEISIKYLQRIYVPSEKDQDDVSGLIQALKNKSIDVIIAPERFGVK